MDSTKPKIFTTKFMVRTAIFSTIAAILYVVPGLQFKLQFFLAFLEVHFDEIPAFIASFAYGPLCGIMVLLIKTIIKLPFTHTATVGEWLDLLYGIALILPASLIYKNHRSLKGALIGLLVGLLTHLLVTFVCSATFVIDMYTFFYSTITSDQILALAQQLNHHVSDVHASIAFYCFLPFNAFKDALVIIITIILYPRIRYFTEKRYQK